MKTYIINVLVSALLLLLFAGCAPQLARTKYGTTENQWGNYIKESYKDWEPTPTPPPINNSSTDNADIGNFSINIVPAAMPDNSLNIPEINNISVDIPENSEISPDLKPINPDTVTYTVKKGDTLWSISCKFFNNDGTKWKKIQEANKEALNTPGNIKPGLTLTIPTN